MRTKVRDRDETGDHVHLFVGRNSSDVGRLATIYAEGDPEAQGMEVARILGYPECCAASYVSMTDRASTSEIVYAAAKRECETPDPLLNVGALRLIPFLPCRFDCGAASAYAQETLHLLFAGEENAEIRDEFRKEMLRPTILFDTYRSIVFQGAVVGNAIRYTTAQVVSQAVSSGQDERLLGVTLGALLERAHKLELTSDSWDFATPEGLVSLPRKRRSPGILLPFQPRAEDTA